MAHEREIAEEQSFLDLSLGALDHMRDEARSLRDSAAVANMRGAGDLVERRSQVWWPGDFSSRYE